MNIPKNGSKKLFELEGVVADCVLVQSTERLGLYGSDSRTRSYLKFELYDKDQFFCVEGVLFRVDVGELVRLYSSKPFDLKQNEIVVVGLDVLDSLGNVKFSYLRVK